MGIPGRHGLRGAEHGACGSSGGVLDVMNGWILSH